MRVATVRHTGPYNRISEAFARLGKIVDGRVDFGPGTEMLAIYYDDPESTPAAELRSDAGLTVASGEKIPDGLVKRTWPRGSMHALHVGPYEQLGDAWGRFMGATARVTPDRKAPTPYDFLATVRRRACLQS